jgi:hypothetical protein
VESLVKARQLEADEIQEYAVQGEISQEGLQNRCNKENIRD